MAKKEETSCAWNCTALGWAVLVVGVLYVLKDLNLSIVDWMPNIDPATVLLLLIGLKIVWMSKRM
ncbi:hypothetical protein HY641_00305 [Candidatus Woesearchaeota archaeon]|nr:hypothetical protein [Candidatus Woesearchaeota archaeon]